MNQYYNERRAYPYYIHQRYRHYRVTRWAYNLRNSLGNETSTPITTRTRACDLMPIIIDLDVILATRKMKSSELAEAIGITPQNLSVLKAGRAKAVRFSTLDAICKHLECQPGDILRYIEEDNK